MTDGGAAHGRTGKNIVIMSDGTGKIGGDGADTNVYKLFRMLENRTPRQAVFYDPGLGTNWARLTGKAFGWGINENIRQCYRFLFDNYQAGDRVFLFGFSRGAFTVRSLAGFIHMFGLLPKARPDLIAKAWGIYHMRRKKARLDRAAGFTRRHHVMWVRVTFLGVWDTVGALVAPVRAIAHALDKIPGLESEFHQIVLTDSVDAAYHALAIDDRRTSFHPTLWAEPVPDQPKRGPRPAQQVWFAGAHSDVGGGYNESGLSDITLQWMVRHALQHGLLLYPDHRVDGRPNPAGALHDSRAGLGVLYREKQRSWTLTGSTPVVHESVRERHRLLRTAYDPWILGEPGVRFVGDPSSAEVFRTP